MVFVIRRTFVVAARASPVPCARVPQRNVYAAQKRARVITDVFGVHPRYVLIHSGDHWRDDDPQMLIALHNR